MLKCHDVVVVAESVPCVRTNVSAVVHHGVVEHAQRLVHDETGWLSIAHIEPRVAVDVEGAQLAARTQFSAS